ncbi:hypothetical protein IKQ26_03290 [bacterium]|nr:hypothetical protein [bacterium]
MAQATNLIISEEGPVKTWTTSADNIFNLYKKKLFNAKECGSSSGCFSGPYKYPSGSNTSNWSTRQDFYNLVLSDGVIIGFGGDNTEFKSSCDLNVAISGDNNVCQIIVVDTNGSKKPNTVGKDTFMFILTEKGLLPAGCQNNNTCPGAGFGCTCRIIRESSVKYM